MFTRIISLLCIFFVLSIHFCISFGQEIKVKNFELVENDLEARTNPREDNNGVKCALLKVAVPAVKGIAFKGMVMGEVDYQPGEYRVYVPEGAKKVKFQHENYVPGEIVFPMPVMSQCVYRVTLEVPDLNPSVYGTLMSEGKRLFEMRDYEKARAAYASAIQSKETPEDLIPSLRSNVAICDTCIVYDKYAKAALARMKRFKDEGATQERVAQWAESGANFMGVLNRYNPCEFYQSRINKLNELIENMPLMVRFAVYQWEKTFAGISESGPMPMVEVWTYSGQEQQAPKDYEKDKSFLKLVGSSTEYRQIGTTDEKGIIDVPFDRKNLPTGIFFRPVGYNKSVKVDYMELSDILAQSRTEYHMRRFRLRMFVDSTK